MKEWWLGMEREGFSEFGEEGELILRKIKERRMARQAREMMILFWVLVSFLEK